MAGSLSKRVKQFRLSAQSAAFDAALDREAVAAAQTLKRAQTLYDSLYPMYAEDKVLTEREYTQMKQAYRVQIDQAQEAVKAVEEKKKACAAQTVQNPWLTACMGFSGETCLTQEMAHALLSRVEVDSGNRVSIELRYQDEYRMLVDLLDTEGKAVGV